LLANIKLYSTVFYTMRNCLQKDDPSAMVQAFLYSQFAGNEATRYGHEMEGVIEQYVKSEYVDIEIRHSGLVAHQSWKYLAGSPDGVGRVQGTDFLLEYNAPYAHYKSRTSVHEAAKTKGFFITVKDGVYDLRRSHDYFYQVQGLMEIFNLPYCIIAVAGFDSFVSVKVERDREFFNDILDKLTHFYFGAILPEHAFPMKRRNGLRTNVVEYEAGDFDLDSRMECE